MAQTKQPLQAILDNINTTVGGLKNSVGTIDQTVSGLRTDVDEISGTISDFMEGFLWETL